MLLVLGGTTEGRKAAEVLEEAGKTFYYSTKTGEQTLILHHGISVDGAKDTEAMRQFCQDHDIRLLIDAAHPFAANLHKTVAVVATELHLPIIRYDRIYPPHTDDITWCHNYDDAIHQLEEAGIERLLMLTGVQTIGRLRSFWQRHVCWCRILDRDTSQQLAVQQGFPEESLIKMSDEKWEITSLISSLQPQAIITKESGISGGFMEKVEAAKAAGIKVFVVERPPIYYQIVNYQLVDGPHGLRRAVEHFLPDFFPLKSGLTTGTCATAAVTAAVLSLQGEEEEAVWVGLPNGESVLVDVESVGYGEATVIKDFSDDPDVTRGCHITARVAVSPEPESGIRFLQGEGVGRVTLPGLGIPVGEPAINPVPRQMITAAVRELTDADLDITISVENGRELAKRTFNERVGVVDGISIIGSSGIVLPLSNEAFIESIGRELQVARAIGCEIIGLASGKRGEEALLAREPELHVIHYGNFIGETLAKAHALGFRRAVLGIMIGKAVKLAEGHLDTHSHKILMNKKFLSDVATSAGIPDATTKLEGITMARELWNLMPPVFFEQIQALCLRHCRTVFPSGTLEVRLVKD